MVTSPHYSWAQVRTRCLGPFLYLVRRFALPYWGDRNPVVSRGVMTVAGRDTGSGLVACEGHLAGWPGCPSPRGPTLHAVDTLSSHTDHAGQPIIVARDQPDRRR
jgi:hypothetical protein